MRRPQPRTRTQQLELRIDELDGRLFITRKLARHLWALLSVQTRSRLWNEVFDHEGAVVVDAAYDAAQVLMERERIHVEPCRRVFDAQAEQYLAIWPNGHERYLNRAQLLMMGGQPADEDAVHTPPKSLWQIAHA